MPDLRMAKTPSDSDVHHIVDVQNVSMLARGKQAADPELSDYASLCGLTTTAWVFNDYSGAVPDRICRSCARTALRTGRAHQTDAGVERLRDASPAEFSIVDDAYPVDLDGTQYDRGDADA